MGAGCCGNEDSGDEDAEEVRIHDKINDGDGDDGEGGGGGGGGNDDDKDCGGLVVVLVLMITMEMMRVAMIIIHNRTQGRYRPS